MLLAIDVGNTNVVFALVRDGAVLHRWRIATDRKRTADQYMVWLGQLMAMEGVERGDVHAAIIASVVPQALFDLKLLCHSFFHVDPLVVGEPACRLGIEVHLPNPAEVGADRLVNAVAAIELERPPLIVVDFGTATTFDVVGASGAYEGGVICPGINLSMEALFNAAARLPRIGVEEPPPGQSVIGKSTVHAMQSGVFWGYCGLIDGLAARIRSELGTRAPLIATGGLAPLFERSTEAIDRVEGDLTIRGLVAIHQLNTGRPA